MSTSDSRPTRTYLCLSGGYLAVAAAALVWQSGAASRHAAFWDLYPLLGQVGVVVCALFAVVGLRARRLPAVVWGLIGSAVLLHAGGDVAWAYDDLVLGRDPTSGLLSNALYVCCYLLTLAGAVLLFRTTHPLGRTRFVLDSAIVALTAGLVAWNLLFEAAWQNAGPSAGSRTPTLVYPMADLVLFTCALFLLHGSQGQRKQLKQAVLLAVTMLVFACSDAIASFCALSGATQTNPLTQLLEMVGFALGGWACLEAWSGTSASSDLTGRKASRPLFAGTIAAPMSALVMAPTAIGYEVASKGTASVATLWICLVLVGAVALRMVVSALDHRKAAEAELRAFNDQLEQTICDRTRSLTAMLKLTAAVGKTLDVGEVLDAAIRELRLAIPCDAAAIWRSASESESMFGNSRPWTASSGTEAEALLKFAAPVACAQAKILAVAELDWADEVLVAPMHHGGELSGWIAVSRLGGHFEPPDVELMTAMGLLIGPALENAVSFDIATRRANLDAVTDLHNHRSLHQQLDAMFERARLKCGELSVLMMDLENFKLFNATYGHRIGDQVLRQVGATIRQECPAAGIVGRYGGDEFVAILPDLGTTGAVELAERFNSRLSEIGFHFGDDDRAIPLAVCTGVASYPSDCDTCEELLTAAARNLATARRAGEGVAWSTEAQRTAKVLRKDPDLAVLDMLVAAVDNKDLYTRRHSEDVAEYAFWTACELGCGDDMIRAIRVAALLHDVGKIGVPRETLAKPARLTDEETCQINRHAWLGAMIVGAFPGLEDLVEVVRHHHERWDGHGYPDGRAGADIPWVARILAVADTFSAMTTDRPYRRALDREVALGEIAKNAGTQFDPLIAEAFLRAVGRRLDERNRSDDLYAQRRAA